jgi:hypothetical protein
MPRSLEVAWTMDFSSLHLRIRSLTEENPSSALLEAAGPNGEWCEATTDLPVTLLTKIGKDLFKLVHGGSTGPSSDVKEVGDQLGRSLMPTPILELYRALLPAPTEPGLTLAAPTFNRGVMEVLASLGQPSGRWL